MFVIDAHVILANILQKKKSVSIRDLNRIRSRIEQEIPDVHIDVTRNNIISAVNEHADMFKLLSDGTIEARTEWSQQLVDQVFNWRIDSSVRDAVLVLLN